MNVDYCTHIHLSDFGRGVHEVLPNVFVFDGTTPQSGYSGLRFLPELGKKLSFSRFLCDPRSGSPWGEGNCLGGAIVSDGGKVMGINDFVRYTWPAITGKRSRLPQLFEEVVATCFMHDWKDLLGIPILDMVRVAYKGLHEFLGDPKDFATIDPALKLVWLHRFYSQSFTQTGRRLDKNVLHAWGLQHEDIERAEQFVQLRGETLPEMMGRLASDPVHALVLKASALSSIACTKTKRASVSLEGWVQGSDLHSSAPYTTWEQIALAQTLFDSEEDLDLTESILRFAKQNRKLPVPMASNILEKTLQTSGCSNFLDADQQHSELEISFTPDLHETNKVGRLQSIGATFQNLPKPYHPHRAANIVAEILTEFLRQTGWDQYEPESLGHGGDLDRKPLTTVEDLAREINPLAAFYFVSHYLKASGVEEADFTTGCANLLSLWFRRFTSHEGGLDAIEVCPTVVWSLISPFTYAPGLVLGNPIEGFFRNSISSHREPGVPQFPADLDFMKGWHSQCGGQLMRGPISSAVDLVFAAWVHMAAHENTIRLRFRDSHGAATDVYLIQIIDQLLTIAIRPNRADGDELFFSRQRAAHRGEYAGFRAASQFYWSEGFAGEPLFENLGTWLGRTSDWTLDPQIKASEWISPVVVFPHHDGVTQEEKETWISVRGPSGAHKFFGAGLTVAEQRKPQRTFRFLAPENEQPYLEVQATEFLNAIESIASQGIRKISFIEAVESNHRLAQSDSKTRLTQLLSNPVLGDPWIPVFLGLQKLLDGLKEGFFFTVTTWTQAGQVSDHGNPYFQIMKEEDGLLHLELGPKATLERINPAILEKMELLGLREPEGPGLPNYYRLIEKPWDTGRVIVEILETLVTFFHVSLSDAFEVTGFGEDKFNSEGLLDEVIEAGGEWPPQLFGIRGYHSFPSVHNLEQNLPDLAPQKLWEKVLEAVGGDETVEGDTIYVALVSPKDARSVLGFGAIVKPNRGAKAPMAFSYNGGWHRSKYFGFAVMAENPPRLVKLSKDAALDVLGQLRGGGLPVPEDLSLPLADEQTPRQAMDAQPIEHNISVLRDRLGPVAWWDRLLVSTEVEEESGSGLGSHEGEAESSKTYLKVPPLEGMSSEDLDSLAKNLWTQMTGKTPESNTDKNGASEKSAQQSEEMGQLILTGFTGEGHSVDFEYVEQGGVRKEVMVCECGWRRLVTSSGKPWSHIEANVKHRQHMDEMGLNETSDGED